MPIHSKSARAHQPPKLSALQKRRKERVDTILPILIKTYPDARCSLDFKSPLQLLVATILSAQCTDERVNKVTPALFVKYPAAADYANASQEQIEEDIRSTGFYRNKARSIRGMAAALVRDHGGEVPDTMEALVALPGVGRKTANVVLGNAMNKSVGIVVDTHVTRVCNRLGLTTNTDAVKIEYDLIPIIPQKYWTLWSHLMIAHGRAICTARNPKCESCPLLPYCPAGKIIVKERAAKRVKGSKK